MSRVTDFRLHLAAKWNLLQRWARACRSSSGLAIILIAATPIVWVLSSWGVRLVYDERIPVLSDRLFRSRDVFDVDVYLELTATYRFGLAGSVLGIGSLLLLRGWGARSLWFVSSYIVASLENRRGNRTAALVTCAIALLAVVRAPGYPMFATNDDPAFAALLSGAWTGEPDPRTGFVGWRLAQALVALAAAAPGVPWWGVTLFAGQSVAVLLLLHLVIRSARAEISQPLWWMALAGALSFGAYAALFLHFTQVSTSLGGAALLLIADRARMRGWAVPHIAVFGIPLVILATEVRADGVVLALVVVTISYFFPLIVLNKMQLAVPMRVALRQSLPAVVLTFGVAALALGASSPSGVDEPSLPSGEWAGPLFPQQACYGEPQKSSWVKLAFQQAGPLSENDIRLINEWVQPSSILFKATSIAGEVAPSSASVRLDCDLVFAIPRLPPRMGVFGLGMIVLTLIPNGMSQANRIIAALSFGGSVGVLLLLSSVARAPLTLVFPALAVSAVGLLLACAASDECKTQDRSQTPVSLDIITVAAFLLPVILGLAVIVERSELADDHALNQVEFTALISEARGLSDSIVMFGWLDPLADGNQALSMPFTIEEGRPLPVAGWAVPLPGLKEVHGKLGTEDWVSAVTDDREVLLVAGQDQVRILMKFLEERRGFTCPAPEVVAESESWVLISRVADSCEG